MTWEGSTDNDDVAGYRVYRDGSPVAQVPARPRPGSMTGWTTPTTATGSPYDASGNESDPQRPCCRANPDTAAAPQPEGGVGDLQRRADLERLQRQRRRDQLRRLPRRPAARHDGAGGDELTDTAPVGNTLHRYRVTARDAAGNAGGPSNEVARTIGVCPTRSVTGGVTDAGGVTNSSSTATGPLATLGSTARSYTDMPWRQHPAPLRSPPVTRPATRARRATREDAADTTAPTAPSGLAGTLSRAHRPPDLDRLDGCRRRHRLHHLPRRRRGRDEHHTDVHRRHAAAGKASTYTVRARDAAATPSAASSSVTSRCRPTIRAPTTPSACAPSGPRDPPDHGRLERLHRQLRREVTTTSSGRTRSTSCSAR